MSEELMGAPKKRMPKRKPTTERYESNSSRESGGGKGLFFSIVVTAIVVGSLVYLWQKSTFDNKENELLITQQSLQQQVTDLQNQLTPATPATAAPAGQNQTPDDQRILSLGYEVSINKNNVVSLTAASGTEAIIVDQKAVADLQKNKETISSAYAPYRLSKNNLVYLSTFVSSGSSTLNRLYTYDLSGKKFTLIHEEKNFSGQLRTLALENNLLVLGAQDVNYVPGKCSSPFAGQDDAMYYSLNLDNINSGLKAYEMPKYKVKEGRQQELKCLEQKP